MCFDNLKDINNINKENVALVSGFGPTNAPTVGTLSMIFRILEFQKMTGIYTHIIISELGALNSRQKPLEELLINAQQFKMFIKKLGFDQLKGEVRTHNDYDHARTFSVVSSALTIDDFILNSEATDKMYERLNLKGNDFSTMVDQTFTIADILLPIIRDKKDGVIVIAGLEEHYYPYLSNIVLERLRNKKGGVETLIPEGAYVGALYGKLISGLFPYVKMSKSIPKSSINLGNKIDEIKSKILNCGKRNEFVILQMIELASNWDMKDIVWAQEAFRNRNEKYEDWENVKIKYCEFLIDIKNIWDECKVEKHSDIRKEIFY